jgi:hypothetical protein
MRVGRDNTVMVDPPIPYQLQPSVLAFRQHAKLLGKFKTAKEL